MNFFIDSAMLSQGWERQRREITRWAEDGKCHGQRMVSGNAHLGQVTQNRFVDARLFKVDSHGLDYIINDLAINMANVGIRHRADLVGA